ncbi:hypothetical protein ACOSP7_004700 [Xanthoceras sorbifolium]
MNIKATSTKQQDHVHKPKDKLQENNHANHVKDRSKVLVSHSAQSSNFTLVCHHCGVKGHIRPWCYQYTSMCKLVSNSKALGKLKHVNVIDKRSNSFVPEKKKFQKPLRNV